MTYWLTPWKFHKLLSKHKTNWLIWHIQHLTATSSKIKRVRKSVCQLPWPNRLMQSRRNLHLKLISCSIKFQPKLKGRGHHRPPNLINVDKSRVRWWAQQISRNHVSLKWQHQKQCSKNRLGSCCSPRNCKGNQLHPREEACSQASRSKRPLMRSSLGRKEMSHCSNIRK